jgi:hypothetical protein
MKLRTRFVGIIDPETSEEPNVARKDENRSKHDPAPLNLPLKFWDSGIRRPLILYTSTTEEERKGNLASSTGVYK